MSNKPKTFIVKIWEHQNTAPTPSQERTVEAVSDIGALNKALSLCYGARIHMVINAKIIDALTGKEKDFKEYYW